MRTRREIIFAVVSDLVTDFIVYDRKEDEDLPRGSIQKAIDSGEITLEEVVEEFKEELWKSIR